jgi:hypothetical protein
MFGWPDFCFPPDERNRSDPQHKVIDAYGLRDPAYKAQNVDSIPHPAVYIFIRTGK